MKRKLLSVFLGIAMVVAGSGFVFAVEQNESLASSIDFSTEVLEFDSLDVGTVVETPVYDENGLYLGTATTTKLAAASGEFKFNLVSMYGGNYACVVKYTTNSSGVSIASGSSINITFVPSGVKHLSTGSLLTGKNGKDAYMSRTFGFADPYDIGPAAETPRIEVTYNNGNVKYSGKVFSF